jgi:hypothetical protein
MSGPEDLPAEATEAAAKAIAERRFGAPPRHPDNFEVWIAEARELAAVALAAALPHIAAKAWQEGFASGEYMAKCWGHVDYWEDYPPNPYIVARGGNQHD